MRERVRGECYETHHTQGDGTKSAVLPIRPPIAEVNAASLQPVLERAVEWYRKAHVPATKVQEVMDLTGTEKAGSAQLPRLRPVVTATPVPINAAQIKAIVQEALENDSRKRAARKPRAATAKKNKKPAKETKKKRKEEEVSSESKSESESEGDAESDGSESEERSGSPQKEKPRRKEKKEKKHKTYKKHAPEKRKRTEPDVRYIPVPILAPDDRDYGRYPPPLVAPGYSSRAMYQDLPFEPRYQDKRNYERERDERERERERERVRDEQEREREREHERERNRDRNRDRDGGYFRSWR